jgi:hypothetical protein
LKPCVHVSTLIFDWTFFRCSQMLASWFYPNLGSKATFCRG